MKNFLLYITLLYFASICIISCNNEPFDYSKLYVSRMDLSGAKSLALIKEKSTRAIEGNFLNAGLYKIDAEGNMTAVAVYFTQNENGGNYKESSHTLTIRPKELYNVTGNYMIAYNCVYFDEVGDEVWVPYYNLLIRKSDGRIWDISDQSDEYRHGPIDLSSTNSMKLSQKFSQSSKGDLYYSNGYVYRFNLDDMIPSLEQITKAGIIGNNFHIQDNGAIWSYDLSSKDHSIDFLWVAWPYSGYDNFHDSKLLELEFGNTDIDLSQSGFEKIDKIELGRTSKLFGCALNNNPFVIFNTGVDAHNLTPEEEEKFQLFCQEQIKPLRADFLDIGSFSGEVNFRHTPIFLQEAPKEFIGLKEENSYWDNKGYLISGVYEGENYVLVTDKSEKTWLTIIDLKNNEWRWLRQMNDKFGGHNPARINYELYGLSDYNNIEYSDRIWIIDNSIDHYGLYWLDLTSFEDGFIPFDFTLPDFIRIDDSYNIRYTYKDNGTFTTFWDNSMDGNKYYLTIDIQTGHGEITMEEPDMYYDTLIPLN